MTGSDQLTALLHTHGPAVARVILHHSARGGRVTTHIELCNAERGIITRMNQALPTNRAGAILTKYYKSVAREDRGDNVHHATFVVSGYQDSDAM